MYSKVVIAFALCVLSTVSAGVVPVAAPLAAAGVIAPYATSYNAHTVNHNIAAPYVAATPVAAPVAVAKYVAAPAAAAVAPVAKYVAAPAAYTAYSAAAPAAYAAYSAAAPAAYAAYSAAAPAAYTAYSAGAPVLPAAAYTAYGAATYPYLF
uniref:Uncharacterized protein n=1 Tax=Anopheles christyi TaxID=43041 RepID=A0A182KEP2_9DIPT